MCITTKASGVLDAIGAVVEAFVIAAVVDVAEVSRKTVEYVIDPIGRNHAAKKPAMMITKAPTMSVVVRVAPNSRHNSLMRTSSQCC